MSQTTADHQTIKARFRIQLPEHTWISEISRSFPDATFRLLTGLKTTTGTIELGEVVSATPTAISESIQAHPSITSYQLLDRTENRSLARYETTESDFYEFVEQSRVAPEYPVTVQDGRFEYDLTAIQREFDQFRSGVEESPLSFEIVSIVRFVETTELLTDRQYQVLDAALREGYFEVPRDCTLANLAETLNIDKSTASETLRRADAQIIKWYLTGETISTRSS